MIRLALAGKLFFANSVPLFLLIPQKSEAIAPLRSLGSHTALSTPEESVRQLAQGNQGLKEYG